MIQPTGQAVPAAMGLEDALIARGARIDRLTGSAGARTVLDVRYDALRGDRCGIGLRRRHVRLYRALSRLLTPVYQSDGRVVPWLRDWLVGSVSRMWPVPQIQAAMVSGLVGNPLKRLGL